MKIFSIVIVIAAMAVVVGGAALSADQREEPGPLERNHRLAPVRKPTQARPTRIPDRDDSADSDSKLFDEQMLRYDKPEGRGSRGGRGGRGRDDDDDDE